MNLSEQAELDLEFTLEDNINGFGIALVIYDELNNDYSLNAQTTDIGFFIDPQTGIGVAGRQVEITIRISTLTNQGAGIPEKDWKVEYTGTNKNLWNAYVQQVKPDRKLGIYNIILEARKV